MIGLHHLGDGVHALEHPAGALFVRVRQGSICYAELHRPGSPDPERWPRPWRHPWARSR